MMARWVIFGEIIIFFAGSLVPVDPEFFLEDTVFHTVKTNAPGLGLFLMDGGFEEMGCVVVVSFYGDVSLWVP